MLKGGVLTPRSFLAYCFSFPGWLCQDLMDIITFRLLLLHTFFLNTIPLCFYLRRGEDQVLVVFLLFFIYMCKTIRTLPPGGYCLCLWVW